MLQMYQLKIPVPVLVVFNVPTTDNNYWRGLTFSFKKIQIIAKLTLKNSFQNHLVVNIFYAKICFTCS